MVIAERDIDKGFFIKWFNENKFLFIENRFIGLGNGFFGR